MFLRLGVLNARIFDFFLACHKIISYILAVLDGP